MSDCFAFKRTEGKRGFLCEVMKTDACQGKACPFYKTKQECAEAEIKTKARLMNLPKEQREYIRGKYGIEI